MEKAIVESLHVVVYAALKRHRGSITELVKRTKKSRVWVNKVLRGKVKGAGAMEILEKAVELIEELEPKEPELTSEQDERMASLLEKVSHLAA